MKVNCESFTWHIDNLSSEKFKFAQSHNGYEWDSYAIGSPIFMLSMVKNGQMKRMVFQLLLSQWRRGSTRSSWLGLFLIDASNEAADISDSRNTFIAWIAGKEDEYTCKVLDRVKDRGVFRTKQFVLYDDLFDESKGLLRDGRLTIVCEVRAITDVVCTNRSLLKRDLVKKEGNTLASDLCKIRKEGKDSDFTVVAKDGREFPVHTLILSSRSAYFDTMFKQDMREKHEKRVVIDDISSEAVAGLLDFIYTDAVPNIKSVAPELLSAAHKYNMPGLMLLCEDTMVSNLNVNNAAQFYQLADLYDANHLLSAVKKFIIRNLKEVKATDGWKQCMYHSAHLADKLLDDMAEIMVHHTSP